MGKKYLLRIDTSAYKKKRCSKTNWEGGTVNDFMRALNGWRVTERSMAGVKRRLCIFDGSLCEEGVNYEWCTKNRGVIKYHDNLCDVERTAYVAPYGFKQGYLNKKAVIETLKKEGYVKVPFSSVYDIRQYDRHYDGCYLEIRAVGQKAG